MPEVMETHIPEGYVESGEQLLQIVEPIWDEGEQTLDIIPSVLEGTSFSLHMKKTFHPTYKYPIVEISPLYTSSAGSEILTDAKCQLLFNAQNGELVVGGWFVNSLHNPELYRHAHGITNFAALVSPYEDALCASAAKAFNMPVKREVFPSTSKLEELYKQRGYEEEKDHEFLKTFQPRE